MPYTNQLLNYRWVRVGTFLSDYFYIILVLISIKLALRYNQVSMIGPMKLVGGTYISLKLLHRKNNFMLSLITLQYKCHFSSSYYIQIIFQCGKAIQEIDRIGFFKMRKIFSNRYLSLGLRTKMLKCFVLSALLYRVEACTLN